MFPIAVVSCLFLLIPGEALAWGVGVHLQVGSRILENLPLLPPALRLLLERYPYDYLYGCIAADITLGKKFTHYLQHCHSWRMGSEVLAAARTDRQRACAHGYMVHLASDTVAHSYYVPYKMVRTFNTTLLKHTYWEMRFEALVDPEIWPLARTLARQDFAENDELLRSVLSDTLFSFSTNKRLFNSVLLVSRLQQWQKVLRSISNSSRWDLGEEESGEYLELAWEAALDVMQHMEQSPYWYADPTGDRALSAARMIRKNLNLLWLDGKFSEQDAELFLSEFRTRLREGITRPDQILELLSAA